MAAEFGEERRGKVGLVAMTVVRNENRGMKEQEDSCTWYRAEVSSISQEEQ